MKRVLGIINLVERSHIGNLARMMERKGPLECHEEYLKKLSSERLSLHENESRQRKLAKEITSLSIESPERKKLIRVKSGLIRHARAIKSGQIPISSTRGSLTSKELKHIVLGQIKFLTGKNAKLKNMLIEEIENTPEINISKLKQIFSIFEQSKENIFDSIDRYIEYDIFNKPDYSKSKRVLEKQVSNTFRHYSALASVIYILIFVNERRQKRNKSGNIHVSNQKKGMRFEEECQIILRSSGYNVRRTRASGDFGVDLVVEFETFSCGIQCKDHAKPVGVAAIQEIEIGKRHYSLDYGVVVSTAGFTPPARELAANTRTLLIPPKGLQNLDVLIESLF